MPGARYEGNEDGRGGYGALQYEQVMDQYKQFNTDPNRPLLVVLHHDGDNFGGGSESYEHGNFQNMVNWAAADPDYDVTPGSNLTVHQADLVLAAHSGAESTTPAVFLARRSSWNPGGKQFGVDQPKDFEIWTFADDVSGLQDVTLKIRVDGDTPLGSTQNETHAGGAEVGTWQSLRMSGVTPTSPSGILAPTVRAQWFGATGAAPQGCCRPPSPGPWPPGSSAPSRPRATPTSTAWSTCSMRQSFSRRACSTRAATCRAHWPRPPCRSRPPGCWALPPVPAGCRRRVVVASPSWLRSAADAVSQAGVPAR